MPLLGSQPPYAQGREPKPNGLRASLRELETEHASGQARFNDARSADSSLLHDSAGRSIGRSTDHGLATELERVVCGSLACQHRWIPPWRSRLYPIFEGKWACSTGCAWAMVEAAIAREVGDGRRDDFADHHHRVPLGLVLLAQGWITQPQLQKALESQRESGSGRIGDWLKQECGVDTACVTRGLSVQWNCPVLTTENFSPEAMAKALPKTFVEQYGILPLRVAGSKILYVGFQDHLDASSAFALEQMSGLRTESGLVAEGRYLEARKQILQCEFAELTRVRVPDRDLLAHSIAAVLAKRRPAASKLVRLRNYYWLRIWTARATKPKKQPGWGLRTAFSLPEHEAHDYLFTIGGAGR